MADRLFLTIEEDGQLKNRWSLLTLEGLKMVDCTSAQLGLLRLIMMRKVSWLPPILDLWVCVDKSILIDLVYLRVKFILIITKTFCYRTATRADICLYGPDKAIISRKTAIRQFISSLFSYWSPITYYSLAP